MPRPTSLAQDPEEKGGAFEVREFMSHQDLLVIDPAKSPRPSKGEAAPPAFHQLFTETVKDYIAHHPTLQQLVR